MKMLPLRKILCPTDFSEASYAALARAATLAAHFDAELLLVHVVESLPSLNSARGLIFGSPQEGEQLAVTESNSKLHQVIEERLPQSVRARAISRFGNAAGEIMNAAREEEVDMIVMSTHGLTGWRQFLVGSTAEQVMRLSACPVLTIRDPGEWRSTNAKGVDAKGSATLGTAKTEGD